MAACGHGHHGTAVAFWGRGQSIELPTLGSALLLAGAIAIALHAGHLQLVYYAAMFVGAWTVWSIARHFLHGEPHPAWRLIKTLALSVVIGVGLSSYVLCQSQPRPDSRRADWRPMSSFSGGHRAPGFIY
jgi:hypothetical protein